LRNWVRISESKPCSSGVEYLQVLLDELSCSQADKINIQKGGTKAFLILIIEMGFVDFEKYTKVSFSLSWMFVFFRRAIFFDLKS